MKASGIPFHNGTIAVAMAALVACSPDEVARAPTGSEEEPRPPQPPTAAPEPSQLSRTLDAVRDLSDATESIPFPEVILASTGRTVLPAGADEPVVQELIDVVSGAAAAVVTAMNSPRAPVRGLRRINEASRFFEDALREAIDADPRVRCSLPQTESGRSLRAGYPDLLLVHVASGRVAFLDPKLFESKSRSSTLRTFYYQPKKMTNKVVSDAHHLLLGIEHDGNDGAWTFLGWELVDLSTVLVRLKAEFQGSNADLYRPSGILRSSRN